MNTLLNTFESKEELSAIIYERRLKEENEFKRMNSSCVYQRKITVSRLIDKYPRIMMIGLPMTICLSVLSVIS